MNRENHRDKDLKNTYMGIAREGHYGEKYEEILLYKQTIPELLTFYETEENGQKGLVYVLDFRVSFLESLEGERMECEHIESFLQSLVRLMHVIDEYLLDPSNLVLEMDYVYGRDGKWSYVYIPGYGEDFWKQMEKLSEDWLNCVDYENEKAVLWAYTFYQKVHSGECSMEEFMQILKLEKTVPETGRVEISLDKAEEWKEETEKSIPKRGLRDWIKMKRPGFLKRKRKEKSDLDFYEGRSKLADTCPNLELPEIHERNERDLLVLIPFGDNELSVICIEKFPVLIGREETEADICLKHGTVSRIHARIEGKGRDIKIVDMSSLNGTYRNGERLKPGNEYVLHAGDIIKLADVEFICQWC